MYEHNGNLIVRTTSGYVEVVLQLNKDGSYTLSPTDKKYSSRPKGAVPTDVKNVIIRHNLVAGDVFPIPEAVTAPPQGQPKATGGTSK